MPHLNTCIHMFAMGTSTSNKVRECRVRIVVTISMLIFNGHLIAEHSSRTVRRPQLHSNRLTSLTQRPMAKRPLPHPPTIPPGTPLSHMGPMPASLTTSTAHTHALRLRASLSLKTSMLTAMVRLIALIWRVRKKVWEMKWLTR